MSDLGIWIIVLTLALAWGAVALVAIARYLDDRDEDIQSVRRFERWRNRLR